jgi:endogenous inhibitor of DNA gyrase (YacG/DUF329 family)
MPNVITVERWCPKCDRLFTWEREGKESTHIDSPCPDCGTPRRPLLKYEGS